ncbi:hypothetical protein L1987_26738 [Smallanthus sonchifolius]|uniref:Uncharacterized protein n=1 Tax=Smallanthus sonchifolius TaxID=185202 RepID=A0ACB9IA76_9ASTR|nr:hypothetical protein L1987_26738 [Smallanthus sonchifolius]
MASLSSLSTVPITTTSLSGRTRSPLFSKTSSHRFKVSCNASSADENPNLILPNTSLNMQNVDRRNLLLGLGGLYGAANLTNIGSASAYPITAPDDISDCVDANSGINDPDRAFRGLKCCPPASATGPIDYVLPEFSQLRIRPAAQRLTPEYVEKYKAAIAIMRALPEDNPHSWKQQGKIHCAYCNGAYNQEMNGHPELQLQIHNGSLFYPFHRWYLYFYERILGKLIDDPTFALPYWNWDNPTGMMLPSVFEDPGPNGNPRTNPVFDPFRDVKHLPPTIIDLQFRGQESGLNCVDQISANLSTMYGQMVTSATSTDAFFGTNPDPVNGTPGTIESGAHTSVHIWTGSSRMPNHEDMGNFYSAGYDPVFYSHHANVDRMWKIWKDLKPNSNQDPTDDDWLNASYVFYDENKQLVRVYNKDCVDHNKLGYDYEPSRIPWIQSRPIPRVKASNIVAQSLGVVKKVEEIEFPVKLDQIVKVLVKRPATKRDENAKKIANEMLFLNGIKFNGEEFFKFDVLVDDVDDGIETTAASSEFAGTFAQVPHNHEHEMFMTSGAAFGITELLEDIEAEEDEYVLVTLVPRAGTEDATISEIKIQLVPIA